MKKTPSRATSQPWIDRCVLQRILSYLQLCSHVYIYIYVKYEYTIKMNVSKLETLHCDGITISSS